jgi:hypothetical protein
MTPEERAAEDQANIELTQKFNALVGGMDP